MKKIIIVAIMLSLVGIVIAEEQTSGIEGYINEEGHRNMEQTILATTEAITVVEGKHVSEAEQTITTTTGQITVVEGKHVSEAEQTITTTTESLKVVEGQKSFE